MKLARISSCSPKRAVIVSLLILALFFLYKESGSSVFLYPALVGMFLYAIVFNPIEVFLVGVFLVSQIRLIRIQDSSLALVGLFLLISQFKYLILNHLKLSVCFILAMISAGITTMLYSDTSLLSMAIRSLVFIVFIYSLPSKTIDLYKNDFIELFILGCVCSVLMSLYGIVKGGGLIFSGSFSAMENDRNFYAANLITGIGATLACFSQERYKLLYLGFAFLLVFGGLITGSRTFFICLIPLLLMVLLQVISSSDKSIRRSALIVLFISVSICIAILPIFLPILDEILLSRFSDNTVSGGSGRTETWSYFLSLTCSSLERFIFGNGQAINYVKVGSVEVVEHNTYIQALSTYGLFGLITIFCSYYTICRRILRGTIIKYKWSLLPLFSTLLFYLTISALYSSIFDISLFICILVIINLNPRKSSIKLKINDCKE